MVHILGTGKLNKKGLIMQLDMGHPGNKIPDTSGNHLDATVYDSTLVKNHSGYSRRFKGVQGSYGVVQASPIFRKMKSVRFWYKPLGRPGVGGASDTIFNLYLDADNQYRICFDSDNQGCNVIGIATVGGTNISRWGKAGEIIPLNEWHCIEVVFSNPMKIWFDGKDWSSTDSIDWGVDSFDNTLRVACKYDGGGNCNMEIGLIEFFEHHRSLDEANRDYRAEKHKYQGRIAKNVLTNPGFENDLTDWSSNTWCVGDPATLVHDFTGVTVVTDKFFSGTKSIKMCPDRSPAYFVQIRQFKYFNQAAPKLVRLEVTASGANIVQTGTDFGVAGYVEYMDNSGEWNPSWLYGNTVAAKWPTGTWGWMTRFKDGMPPKPVKYIYVDITISDSWATVPAPAVWLDNVVLFEP